MMTRYAALTKHVQKELERGKEKRMKRIGLFLYSPRIGASELRLENAKQRRKSSSKCSKRSTVLPKVKFNVKN